MSDKKDWLHFAKSDLTSSARLICFTHSGGSQGSFNSWRSQLPDWLELVKVQIPGRAGARNGKPFDDAGELLAALFEQVETLMDKPLAIYGHSMGALMAFELARYMRREYGKLPTGLFISGRRAPHVNIPEDQRLYNLPEDKLIKRLVDTGGEASSFLCNPRWASYYLESIRADLSVSDQYCCTEEAKLECPVAAFLGENDTLIPQSCWSLWSEQAGGQFERHFYPGTHFFSAEGQRMMIARIVELTTAAMAQHAELAVCA